LPSSSDPIPVCADDARRLRSLVIGLLDPDSLPEVERCPAGFLGIAK